MERNWFQSWNLLLFSSLDCCFFSFDSVSNSIPSPFWMECMQMRILCNQKMSLSLCACTRVRENNQLPRQMSWSTNKNHLVFSIELFQISLIFHSLWNSFCIFQLNYFCPFLPFQIYLSLLLALFFSPFHFLLLSASVDLYAFHSHTLCTMYLIFQLNVPSMKFMCRIEILTLLLCFQIHTHQTTVSVLRYKGF